MALIIHSNQFEQLKEIERIAETTYKRRTIKFNIIDRIKEEVEVRWERMDKVLKVIDEIVYRLSDRGFSFIGREKLAKVCQVSLSTVDKSLRLIKESGLFVVCYRHNPKANGYKTPVIICTVHKNYKAISDVLGLKLLKEKINQKKRLIEAKKNKEENKVEKPEIPLYNWLEEGKKVPTNIFTLKQEFNKHIYNTELIQKVSKLSTDNIVRYIALKIEDYKNNGGNIQHLSSFVEKTFAHVVKMSAVIKGVRMPAKPHRSSSEQSEEIPLYNWLEQ